MRRIDDDVVVEFQVIRVERVEQSFCQLFRLVVPHQIRSTGGIDEQRVAREHAPRFWRSLLLRGLIGHMFWRVPWRMTGGQYQITEFKGVGILDRFVIEIVLRFPLFTYINGRGFDAISQLTRSTYEVSVYVCFEDMRDGYFSPASQLDVNVDVRSRINHSRRSGPIITEKIGEFSNAFRRNGFEDHGHSQFLKKRPQRKWKLQTRSIGLDELQGDVFVRFGSVIFPQSPSA